jgi:hypothetical protein
LLGRAFPFRRGFIHPLLDIARLLGHLANDPAGISVKNAIAVDITNVAHGLAHVFIELKFGVARDLPREHHQIALGQCFAGHPAERVLLQTGIEDVIANRVADFVGMAFGDGFRGKNVTARHGETLNRLKGYNVTTVNWSGVVTI